MQKESPDSCGTAASFLSISVLALDFGLNSCLFHLISRAEKATLFSGLLYDL